MELYNRIGDETGNTLRLAAPCKINLHLEVRNLRADGYHNLESLFVTLAFGDTLIFTTGEKAGRGAVFMDCAISRDSALCGSLSHEPSSLDVDTAIPLEKNSVYQAVSLFRSRTGFSKGVNITVEKRVPLGSGLGGGSSDAASALMGMNIFAGGAAGPEELAEMALELGSDVPFFLSQGGAAWVSGRGERISPLPFPQDLYILLVCPDFPSHTGAAFRLLDGDRANHPPSARQDHEELIRRLGQDPKTWTFRNDFLPVFTGLFGDRDDSRAQAYRRILGDIRGAGADFAGLSGAGSSCFGVFTDKDAAVEAKKALSPQSFVRLTVPLARFSNRVLE